MTNEENSITYEDITELEMQKSLLLFSGGLDTTTILYMLTQEEIPVECLIYNYGQQAQEEIRHAIKTCQKLHVKYKVMDLKNLEMSGELGDGGNIKNNVDIIIPNRNSVFLSVATQYAIRNGFEAIYVGSKQGVKSCPDETYEFIEEYNYLNMKSDIKYIPIKAPLIMMDTPEVIDQALQLKVPLRETWSCFGNKTERCNKCTNCKIFKEILEMKQEEYQGYVENINTYLKEFE